MIETLLNLYRTVKAAIFGTSSEVAAAPKVAQAAERLAPAPIPAADVSPEKAITLAPEPVSAAPEILVEPAAATASVDGWSVRTCVDPVFVKVGRVYLDSGDLIIRSDQDSRGFLLSEDDIDKALTGGSGTVRLLDLTATVGTAHLSTSGLALNMVIDQQLHTIPLRSLIPVLNGNHRKAPLFVLADDVAPDVGGETGKIFFWV